MAIRWVQRESLLQQSAANKTGTKFYQAGVAHDDVTDMYYVLFNWGEGTPVLDFLSGQTQCAGAFLNLMAAQAEANKKLNTKTRGGYNPYGGSEDKTELEPRIRKIALEKDPAAQTPVPTGVPTPDPDRKQVLGQDVARIISMAALDATAAQQALTVRQALLDDKAKLLAELDTIDSQVELLNAKLIS